MPAQYMKPYVQTNKSDYVDAEAIVEAVQRPRMRFVPINTEEQLDLQALHRVRERWVMRRKAVVNQIRSLLMERQGNFGKMFIRQKLLKIQSVAGSSKMRKMAKILCQKYYKWRFPERSVQSISATPATPYPLDCSVCPSLLRVLFRLHNAAV